jgi:hypothetical protein
MSRVDCKSNRNIRIISSYVESLLGDAACLFDGLPFPNTRYTCAKDYLTDEDEWTVNGRDKLSQKWSFKSEPLWKGFGINCTLSNLIPG